MIHCIHQEDAAALDLADEQSQGLESPIGEVPQRPDTRRRQAKVACQLADQQLEVKVTTSCPALCPMAPLSHHKLV